MKRNPTNDICRKISHALICALTGQTKIQVTILAYSVVAFLLLGYVSAQILTSVLAQEISDLTEERRQYKENLSKLTSDYVALSSRARISEYCETVLGMHQATDGSFERFAVRDSDGDYIEPIEFSQRYSPVPDAFRFSLHRESGNPAK